MKAFKLTDFWGFCKHLRINSKEFGSISLAKPYGPQRWVMGQIARGLDQGIHDFTVLKCRQVGLSTITLALDLYWPFTHRGLDGSLITHDDKAHVSFRTQLQEMYDSLPKMLKPRSTSHNREEFVFKFPDNTMSRLQYQIAGTRATGGGALGRSKGNAFVHATEMSSWGDQDGYMSLKNSLAEINPNRLYLWESTARGYNKFQELWDVARRAVTQQAIFTSWWAHEMYRVERGSAIYNTYWGEQGRMTKEERELARDVALLYKDQLEYLYGTAEIRPEQIAWYRWYSEEKTSDPDMVRQEMPWTEHQAFVVTGSQFFASKWLSDSYKRVNAEGSPAYFRVEVRHHMADTHVITSPPKVANLTVWATPVEKAYYVLGADPAYGSSDWADSFVVSVWRAYADRLEQVAEYATPDCLPYQFAWVMCYMAGCYAPCHWNLEVNGPGAAVLGELDNLKRMQWAGSKQDRQTMKNFLGGMREFLYTRADQINRTPTARGTSSTLKEKRRYFDTYRDYCSRGMVMPHSRRLLDEMKWVTNEPGEAPSAKGRNKDDRVIGACLATQMWHDKMRPKLLAQGITYNRTESTPGRQMSVLEQMIQRRQKLLGINQQDASMIPQARLPR